MICRMNRIHLTLRSFLTCLSLLIASAAHGHSGAVGADGCHEDTARGKRHCHPERKSSRAAAPAQPQFTSARPPRAGDEGVFFGPLLRVTDGDTLRVKVQGVGMDFRLSQIDAPEKSQPYGSEARADLLRLVRGKQVVLVPIDTDRYGRTVADVWIGSRNVNRELVKNGSAWFYDEFSRDAALYELEQQARIAKRGLWALPAAQRIEPWRWRHEKR
jgi:endonuclease YncB( thermonuclease family)